MIHSIEWCLSHFPFTRSVMPYAIGFALVQSVSLRWPTQNRACPSTWLPFAAHFLANPNINNNVSSTWLTSFRNLNQSMIRLAFLGCSFECQDDYELLRHCGCMCRKQQQEQAMASEHQQRENGLRQHYEPEIRRYVITNAPRKPS